MSVTASKCQSVVGLNVCVATSHCVRREAPARDPPFCSLCRALCGPHVADWSPQAGASTRCSLSPQLSVCQAHSRCSWVLCAQRRVWGTLCCAYPESAHYLSPLRPEETLRRLTRADFSRNLSLLCFIGI